MFVAFSQVQGTVTTLSRVAGGPMEKLMSFCSQDSELYPEKFQLLKKEKEL